MTPSEAIKELAEKIAVRTAKTLGVSDVIAQSFWTIIAPLIPVLIEIIKGQCDPQDGAALRELAERPIVGRIMRNRIHRGVQLELNNRDDFREFGQPIATQFAEVVFDEANDELVTAALKSEPAPIWGVFAS